MMLMFFFSLSTYRQSGTKPKLVATILANNFGNHLCMGYQNW